MIINNIFKNLPENIPEELTETLAETEIIRIERIISNGHTSPSGYWYDQDKDEYVLLLEGSAGLLFEGEEKTVEMRPGDYVDIPAHLRHRVEWTDPDKKTIWLVIFH